MSLTDRYLLVSVVERGNVSGLAVALDNLCYLFVDIKDPIGDEPIHPPVFMNVGILIHPRNTDFRFIVHFVIHFRFLSISEFIIHNLCSFFNERHYHFNQCPYQKTNKNQV